MDTFPHFLCIGASKAATSWLYLSLMRHPGVFVPVVKESHYFRESSPTPVPWAATLRRLQVETLRELRDCKPQRLSGHRQVEAQLQHFLADRVDDAWYRKVFSFAAENEVAGEVCPTYFAMSGEDIARVKAMNPEMAVVLLVRDPVDRCWSHIRMQHRQEGESGDIQRAFEVPGGLSMYLDATAYDQAIPRWQTAFGARLGIWVFDDIAERPESVLDEILWHIGADPSDLPALGVKNKGGSEPLPERFRKKLYTALQPQYEFLGDHFPARVAQWRACHERALRLSA